MPGAALPKPPASTRRRRLLRRRSRLRRARPTTFVGPLGVLVLALGGPLGDSAPAIDPIELAQMLPGSRGIGGQIVAVGRFVGQERGVGSQDSVPRGQLNQLLDQLVVFAFEVDLVEDVAHAADGPELFDEAVGGVAALLHEGGRKIELLVPGSHFAADRHLGRAGPLVAAHQHELLAGKQVAYLGRINAIDRLAVLDFRPVDVEQDGQIGHHRRADPVVKPGHLGLDVLVGPHVVALAEIDPGQLVQQPAVDVVAYAEGEHPGVDFVVRLGCRDDLPLVGLAVGRQPVGQKDHEIWPAGVLQLAERRVERRKYSCCRRDTDFPRSRARPCAFRR